MIHGNFLNVDLSPADVVTLYLATDANELLRPNLEKYLKKGARVVSHEYAVPGWKPTLVDKDPEAPRSHDLSLRDAAQEEVASRASWPLFDVAGVGLNATDTLILLPHFPPYGGKAPFEREMLEPRRTSRHRDGHLRQARAARQIYRNGGRRRARPHSAGQPARDRHQSG